MTRHDFFSEADDGGDGGAGLYDRWAGSYDDDLTEQGYATPRRAAAALAAQDVPRDAPVLDFGCGTGLSGAALRDEGFAVIDGWDVSQGMLDLAAEKGCYRALTQIDPDAPPPAAEGDYAAVVAAGVISVGAAPPETFDAIMALLGPGGVFVFSFNDHTLEDSRYESRLMEWIDCGSAELLSREHGAHLPGLDLGSTVYALRKR